MSHLRERRGFPLNPWRGVVRLQRRGAMHPAKFTVCACTGHCGFQSASKLVKIEGFARDKREVYVEGKRLTKPICSGGALRAELAA